MADKVIIGSFLILILAVAGGLLIWGYGGQTEFVPAGPAEVVRQYFDSWGRQDWPNMYAALSDGFKRQEPTARNLTAFRDYAKAQGIAGIEIIRISEQMRNTMIASVSYEVVFILADRRQPVEGVFSLAYRTGDVVSGWKLLHPYGKMAGQP